LRYVASLALVVIALFALVLPSLGQAPLERAEIYFLDAARAMVESGDWVVPRYQGEPFFDKPPLAYWLMASSFVVLGPEVGAARLVPAAAAVLLVLATAWLGTLLFDRRTALFGAVVLSTTLAFLSFARVAMSDMVLALLTTLSVALAVRASGPGRPRYVVPALGATLGLGFAAKGPIALVVVLPALFALWRRDRRRLALTASELALCGFAFAVLGLGWYVLVALRLGLEPLAYFFVRENLVRFAGQAYDVGRPFWFYLPAYAAGGLPWSPLLPIAVWRLLSRREGAQSERSSAVLLATWVAIVLVPLSLSRGKIDYYLLPLYPALSLLVGRYLAAVPWPRLDRVYLRVVLVALAGFLVLVVVHPPRVAPEWLPGPFARSLLAAAVVVSLVGALGAVARLRPARVLAAVGGGMAACWLVVAAWFLPAFVSAQPNRAIVEDVVREHRYVPGLRLVSCEDPTRARRDVLFHARLLTEERCDLWALAASRLPYLLLIGPDEDRSFRSIPRYREVARYRGLPADVLTLDGLLSLREPETLVLAANFDTTDPVAVRKAKRAYRKAIKRERRARRGTTPAPRKRRGRRGKSTPPAAESPQTPRPRPRRVGPRPRPGAGIRPRGPRPR